MSEEKKTPREGSSEQEQLSIEELLAKARSAGESREETPEIGLSTDTEVLPPREEPAAVTVSGEDNKTRLFDTPQKPAKEKKESKWDKTKLTLTILKYTGKFSFKSVLFLLRKALTYTLNVALTAIIVGILVGAVCVFAL